MMKPVTWIVEPEIFPPRYAAFLDAIERLGHRRIVWSDDWWNTRRWPRLEREPVLFHGSLGNASRIPRELPWKPGAFCATDRFSCSSWYPSAAAWLLHTKWVFSTVAALVANPGEVTAPLGTPERVFVRPDSPLKPFSGRVVATPNLNLKALDHGFYYENVDLPVVVAPVRQVEREWRFVIARGRVIAGSPYVAEGRQALVNDPDLPMATAAAVAMGLSAPQEVYILDLCRCDGQVRLLELNPFSGADLYGCDPESVVTAVSEVVAGSR